MKHSLNKENFRAAVVLSLSLSVTILSFSYNLGKENLFLILNTDAGIVADTFFAGFTFGGDGVIWIPALLFVHFILKRKDAVVLLVASFILSTIFTQVTKNFIFPDEPRPTKAIAINNLIHIVDGVDVHSIGSFPSGHTGTAFCIYLLFCLLLPTRSWVLVGFLYAAIVGYSRVYLAQHFPVDVGAGIIVAIISVWSSIKIQEYWWKRKYK